MTAIMSTSNEDNQTGAAQQAARLITPPMSPTRDDEFYCRDIVFLVSRSVIFL